MNQGVFDVIEKVLARLEVHISFFVPAERTLHKACNWILCNTYSASQEASKNVEVYRKNILHKSFLHSIYSCDKVRIKQSNDIHLMKKVTGLFAWRRTCMSRLQWEQLLCEKRMRMGYRGKSEEQEWPMYVTRNEFEADYDRIVGSSSVRRLQDKAQVFPLQKNDVVRTRLTHSMEVSAIARSMGKTVGINLEKKGIFTREQTEMLAGMLQTAGLIHDLGNPPFGHYGETAIRNWYKEKKNISTDTQNQEDADFAHFDGNVQNLRIVTKLQIMNDQYGANFTYGTLASIIKYPYSSVNMPEGKEKFGYFKSEQHIVEKVWENTGLAKGIRHPATYLLEAADDIVYLCDDIEDGVKKGYVSWEKEYDRLKTKVADELKKKHKDPDKYKTIFEKIENNPPTSDLSKNEQVLSKVKLFRNYIQGYLIKATVHAFLEDYYEEIMNGDFGLQELLKDEEVLVKTLKDITRRNCFVCDEVLSLEVVGEKVIRELLDTFYKIVDFKDVKNLEKSKIYEGKLYHMISDNYKYIARFDYGLNKYRDLKDINEYDKMHLIIDFVSGMTDSYAVMLYKKLLGISLPE